MNFKQIALIRRLLISELVDVAMRAECAKENCAYFWKEATPGTDEGRNAFWDLNHARSERRKLIARRNLIEDTLRDLKLAEKAKHVMQDIGCNNYAEAREALDCDRLVLEINYDEACEKLERRRAMIERGIL